MQSEKTLHYILGFALVLIAVFAVASLVMINSQADSISTSTSVNNVAPTVTSVFVSAGQYGQADTYSGGTINNLVAGGTRTIHVNGIVNDNNGQADIAAVRGKIYRSGYGAVACATTTSNECYFITTCDLSTAGVTSTQQKYDCSIDLQYYTDSTSTGGEFPAENWVVDVKVSDVAGLNATDVSVTKEVETRLGLSIPSSINYGAMALGASTTAGNNQEMSIAQQGNDVADVEVSMTAASLSCSGIGSIPRANQQWSLTDVAYNGSGTNALGSDPALGDTNLNVGYRHGSNPSKILYWNITIPSTGVLGSCTGTTTISAIAG